MAAKKKKTAAKSNRRRTGNTKNSGLISRLASRLRFFLTRSVLVLAVTAFVIASLVVLWTDFQVRHQFDGKRWALPAKVYSRPLELYPDLALTVDELETELQMLSYSKVARVTKAGEYARRGNEIQLFSRGFQFWDGTEPSLQVGVSFSQERIRSIRQLPFAGTDMAADLPLALVRIEPLVIGGFYPNHKEDRILVRLEQAPDLLVETLLTVEDRGFFQHFGLSIRGIARAFLSNVKAGKIEQGGSTLTQQLVKNFYLNNERSITRKIKEAVMALLLEFHYQKEEILETYLNEVYLAQAGNYGVHGFGLASAYYFGESFEHLNVPQVALLVGLVKGPSYYDPRKYPQRALQRRNQVLDLIHAEGFIDEIAWQRYRRAPLGVVENPAYFHYRYPAYLDLVKRQLKQNYREQDIHNQGLKIFTSLDPRIQRIAENQLQYSLQQLEQSHGESLQDLQGAVVLTAPQSGEVVAMVGGRNVRNPGFNRALDAVRPIGSLIKPAIYLTALERYGDYSLASLISDEPLQVPTMEGDFWSPSNFDNTSHGQVTLLEALSRSYNQAAARIGLDLGVDQVIETLQRLGLRRELPAYPATLLGAGGLAPVEVAQIFQTLANQGFQQPIRAIREVMDAQGNSLSRYPYSVKQVVDPAAAYLINYALAEVMQAGTGKSVYYSLPKQITVAGKTGTTNDMRDSWFAGYSDDFLGVVWLGRDDNGATPLTGSAGALRVWRKIFRQLDPQALSLIKADDVEFIWYDAEAGKRSGVLCDGAIKIPMQKHSIPDEWTSCGQGDRVINKVKSWFN